MKKNIQQDIFVSVVMAVYNGETYLQQSIDTVLGQTYQNFEFIIVDDCSNDRTNEILHQMKDERIIIIRNETNLGLGGSLNRAVKQAKGKYILRMDADDLCFKNRFEVQIACMEKHPNIYMAFHDMIWFQEGKCLRMLDTNDYAPEYLKATLLFYNTVLHPCVIFRREVFEEFSYPAQFTVAEDIGLWVQIMRKYDIVRFSGNLMLYRIHPGQVGKTATSLQRSQNKEVKIPLLTEIFGTVSEHEIELHNQISFKQLPVDEKEAFIYLKQLIKANKKTRVCSPYHLKQIAIRMYLTLAHYQNYKKTAMLRRIFSFGLFETLWLLMRAMISGGRNYYDFLRGRRQAKREGLCDADAN